MKRIFFDRRIVTPEGVVEEHPVRVRLSNHRTLALVASLLSLVIAASAGAAALRVATLGDSITDEYRGTVGTPFGPKDVPAMNWVEQLADDRSAYFDFGSLESDPSVRGEPRNDGYSQNWARYGAAAVGPGWSVEPFDSQVAGAAAQITSGDVDFAYILIGSNDFALREYAGLTFDPADPGYQAFAQSIFDATFAAVDTLQAAGTTPIAVGWFGVYVVGVAPTPQEMSDAAYALNLEIWAEAIHRGVPYVNLYLFQAPGSLALDPTRQNLMFAGELIPLASVADAADLAPPGTPGVGPCSTSGCATETYAFNYLTHDGAHASSIPSGFMANEFIKTVNYHFGSSIPLLTEQEILANAIGEPPPCDDGIDNDGDGLIDYPNDRGCTDASDSSEREWTLICDDGVDNDGDGLIDYPDDPGCYNTLWVSENPQCMDGVDNDGDGLIDYPDDPACPSAFWFIETSQCQNGIDDDGDGTMDYDAGLSVNGYADPAGPDPECVGRPEGLNEKCGLGLELMLGLPLLMWFWRRRSRRF